MISKEERSNWSTVGLLIVEKKQEKIKWGRDDIFLRTIFKRKRGKTNVNVDRETCAT